MDNDFHETESIFWLFDGLEVQDMDKAHNIRNASLTNGHDSAKQSTTIDLSTKATNGVVNGVKTELSEPPTEEKGTIALPN